MHGRRKFVLLIGALAALAACSPGGESATSSAGADRPSAPLVPAFLPEKDELTLGFIKLTDMAPLAIAREMGFFEDEGLYVTLEPQANWRVLLDRVISGELDGAHMLAGQPIASAIGYGAQAPIVTPFVMDMNGKGITVSNAVWQAMKPHVETDADGRPDHPIAADALAPVVDAHGARGEAFNMGMVFPVSSHNYMLRYWLAAGALHPGFYAPGDATGQIGADVLLSVTPPPQMPATLSAGTIHGYSVGEPWNQQAVFMGIGVPVGIDTDFWETNPDKVFGVTEAFAEQNPNTVRALTRALIRASVWLDEDGNANRAEAARILSRPEYVGADEAVIANSMTGVFEYEKGDIRDAPDFNVFFRDHASYPFLSDAVWTLTQMRRWGQIPEAQPDDWYADIARRVYRPDIYMDAARSLAEDGLADDADFPWETDGYRPPAPNLLDSVIYDGRAPNAYLEALEIGLKQDQRVSGGRVVGGGQ